MSECRRRQALFQAFMAIFDQDFAGQMLNFDSDTADYYARIAAGRRIAGRPIAQFDAMIAAVARSRGALTCFMSVDRVLNPIHPGPLENLSGWRRGATRLAEPAPSDKTPQARIPQQVRNVP